MRRLEETLLGAGQDSAPRLLERVAEEIDRFQVGQQADDMALLLLRFTGKDIQQTRSTSPDAPRPQG
jgi:serine phosphatase RsbU (regulator of sigma subunit)